MTIITCEFCGPTRVAPHDVNCPTRKPAVNPALTAHVDQQVREVAQLHRGGVFLGYTDIPRAYTHPLLDPNYLMDFPATIAAMEKKPEPLVTRNPTHETMPGRFGAVCKCGYDPHETHPEAGRGQLFAYVGQHIREASHA